jgi:hypothetical protein
MSLLHEKPKRVDVSLSSPEDGKRSSFRNFMFSSYLEFFTMDKVHKPSGFENKSRGKCFQPNYNVTKPGGSTYKKKKKRKIKRCRRFAEFQDERNVAFNGRILHWFEHEQLGNSCAASEGNLPP